MFHYMDIRAVFYHARTLLKEQQDTACLGQALQSFNFALTESEQHITAYLLGWSYVQAKQWDRAMQVLSPLVDLSAYGMEQDVLERERFAYALFCLGLVALRLTRFDEATLHFMLCLKVMRGQRIHLPALRLKVVSFVAFTYFVRGLYTAAIHQYETALRLARYYADDSELPHVCYGLCDASIHVNDLDRAEQFGLDALHLSRRGEDQPMEALTLHTLGYLSCLRDRYEQAAAWYVQSFELARDHKAHELAAINGLALIDLYLDRDNLPSANSYSQVVMQLVEHIPDKLVCGRIYCMLGRVTARAAQDVSQEMRHDLLQEALTWYERSLQLLDHPMLSQHLAEVYECRAQVLEALGQAEDAIHCWRSAYALVSQQKPVYMAEC